MKDLSTSLNRQGFGLGGGMSTADSGPTQKRNIRLGIEILIKFDPSSNWIYIYKFINYSNFSVTVCEIVYDKIEKVKMHCH